MTSKHISTKGLSLVELLASLFIVAILASLLLVAVQNAREGSRKITCGGNLKQIGLGVSNYVSAFDVFPPGGMYNGYSAHVRILPYIEQEAIHDQIDYAVDQEDATDLIDFETPQPYKCPSAVIISGSTGLITQTSYVGVFAGGIEDRQNGLLITIGDGKFVKSSQVIDGLSNTLLFIETGSFGRETVDDIPGVPLRSRSYDMPRAYRFPIDVDQFFADCNDLTVGTQNILSLGGSWMDGSTGVTRMSCVFPTLPRNCMNYGSTVNALYTPSSVHPGAFTVVLADGAVRRFSESIDTEIWRGLGSRDGGEVFTIPE